MMFSVTVIFSFLILFVPLISGKVLCKSGEKIYEEDLIYDCIEGRKVYYGCKIDGIEYKLNTTKDEGNLRHFLCFKRYNDVRPNVVIGCVTDDGIFINETKSVQQKDGFQFNCTKNGRIFTFTKTPPPPPYFPPPPFPPHPSKPSSGCKLGQTKLVSHRFILECQKTENEGQNAFHFTACFSPPKYGNDKMKRVKIEVGKTFDTFFNRKSELGIRQKCHSKGDKYFYDEIGCIVGKEFVKPDEIFFNGTDAILCVQKNLGKLQLKTLNPKKLVQKLCSKGSEKMK